MCGSTIDITRTMLTEVDKVVKCMAYTYSDLMFCTVTGKSEEFG